MKKMRRKDNQEEESESFVFRGSHEKGVPACIATVSSHYSVSIFTVMIQSGERQ